ncbi:MAG: glycosyltransferase family 39 protein [Deltaproteobacteria bacterium]|nr:glycosyltransferase family 39 protein [Deltaproteobacteria bacterium]
MSPFYPYLLAVFTNAAGELNATAVRIFQAVCDAGTAACVSLVAGRIGGRSAAVLAGAAAALYAPMIYFTGIILVATVQTLFLTIALVMLLHADDQPEQRNLLWTVAGVTLGFAAVLRPTILAVVLAVVAVEAVLAWRDRDRRRVRWRAATLLLAGAALMIAPFTLRNVTRGGEPVLLSANGGFNFFIGNNARATGVFHLPDAVDPFHDVLGKSFAERAAGRAMTYREAGAWWRARAMADIRENPVRWIGLMAKKAALFFHPVEIPQLGASFEWHRRHAWPLRFPLDARTVLILALLCPLAVAASAGRKPFSPFCGRPRYRPPTSPRWCRFS